MKHKRFVAGAVCPQCKQVDKTALSKQGEQSIRECVACGHREVLDALGQQTEIPTRVNRTDPEQVVKGENRPVQILDPGAFKSGSKPGSKH